MIWSLLLAVPLTLGQVIKIPIGNQGGMILLDAAVIFFCLLGLSRLKLNNLPLFIKTALVFILICFLSLIFTPIKLTSAEFLTSFSYLIRFSAYILFGWLIYQNILPPSKKIIPVLVISGISLAAAGLLQFIFIPDLGFLAKFGWDPHYFRAVSTFLDPNFLGSFLVLTMLLIFNTKFVTNKHLRIIALSLVYLTLLVTFSRGSYLAFFVSFITYSILKRSVKMFTLTIILSLGLIFGFQIYQQLVAQPKKIDRVQSAESRINSWHQGWQLFTKNPILGVGFNTYRYALKQYQLADSKFLESHGASTNDSSLLYVAATTGLIGLISYLFFLITLTSSKFKLLLIAALVGLIGQSFLVNNLFYPPILFWLILISAQS